MKLVPIGKNILVKPSTQEDKTASGLIIKTEGDEKPQKGEVLEIGVDVKVIKKGDQIAFKKYVPDEVEIDGTIYLIMKEEDILLVIQ